jgi:hypothetical protein
MTISLEKIFFSYILENKKYFEIVEPLYFRNNEIQFVYNVIRKYMTKNIEVDIPTPKQILEMVQLEDKEGIITKEILKAVLTTSLKDYDEFNFIIPKMNAWILSHRIKNGTIDIVDETRNLDAITDFEEVVVSANKIKSIVDQMSNTSFIHDEDMGTDFDDAESHVQDTARFKVSSGFDTIDHMLGGGWDIQTLNVVMAETNNGKCVHKDTLIAVKNKKTNSIFQISILDLFSNVRDKKTTHKV